MSQIIDQSNHDTNAAKQIISRICQKKLVLCFMLTQTRTLEYFINQWTCLSIMNQSNHDTNMSKQIVNEICQNKNNFMFHVNSNTDT